MKNWIAVVLLSVLVLGSKPIFAGDYPDPYEVGAQYYTLLLENDRVRVSDVKFKPGDKMAMHSHPDHIVYALSPGKIKFEYPNSTTKEVEIQAGQVLWAGAESHATENIGGTDLHVLVVELKK